MENKQKQDDNEMDRHSPVVTGHGQPASVWGWFLHPGWQSRCDTLH